MISYARFSAAVRFETGYDDRRCLSPGGAAEPRLQDEPELRPEDAVNDEIDGRIEYLQHVADLYEKELRAETLLRLIAPDYLDNPRRSVTQDEHQNDDDHHQGDVVVVVVLTQPELLSTSLHPTIGQRQFGVEERQQNQRQYEAEYIIKTVEIEKAVHPAVAERRPN